jgi:hypothetical protein
MGAWFTAYKIKDPEVFEAIINGGDKVGFSVESFLDKVMVDFNREVKNNIISDKLKVEMKKNNKNLKEKILAIFASESFERTLVPELAFEIEWGNVGEPVNKVVVDEKGVETLQPVGKGEFVTEEGIIVVDEQSNLVEVRELPAEPVVETPEAPASGSTSGDTMTTIVAEDVVSGDTSTTGQTETKMRGIETPINQLIDLTKDGLYLIDVLVEGGMIKDAVMNSQSTLLSKQYAFGDMEKRLKEFIPKDKAGSYTINVEVNAEGNYAWGSISSWTTLKFQNETQLVELQNKIVELEAKVNEPIGDPILTPEVKVLTPAEFNKLSAYEKLMHNKGIKAV